MPVKQVVVGGTIPNILTHKRDIGCITARITKDERILTKMYFHGSVLTQNEINDIIEKKTGEKLDLSEVGTRLGPPTT